MYYHLMGNDLKTTNRSFALLTTNRSCALLCNVDVTLIVFIFKKFLNLLLFRKKVFEKQEFFFLEIKRFLPMLPLC